MGIDYGFYADIRKKNKTEHPEWMPLKVIDDNPVMIGRSIYYNLYEWIRNDCDEPINSGECYPFDEYEVDDGIFDYTISYDKLVNKSMEKWEREVWTTKQGVKDYDQGDTWEPTPTHSDDPLGFAYYYIPIDGIVEPAKILVHRIEALMEWNDFSFYEYEVRVRVRIYP